jgi:two-component system, NtrC family, sensor kinase
MSYPQQVGINPVWRRRLLKVFPGHYDITKEIFEPEECMQDEKGTYFSVFEYFPCPVILLNSKDEIEHMNEAAKHVFDGIALKSEYPDAARVFPWLAGDLRASKDEQFQERNFERRFVEANGDRIYCVMLKTLSRENGNPRGYLLVMNDVTDHNRSPEESHQDRQEDLMKRHEDLNRIFRQVEIAKREWESTMDCVGDMVILTDREGKIRRCNRAVKGFLQKPYHELLDKNLDIMLAEHGLRIVMSHGKSIELFHEPTGKWFVINTYPFSDSDPEDVSGNVVMIHDSTELKQITEKLERTNRELEKAYSELKAAQSRILQQEKMASIGQLAAGVAHEINNPIGFIMSNLGSLQRYMDKLNQFMTFQAGALDDLARQQGAESEYITDKVGEQRRSLKIDYIMEDTENLITESLDGTNRVKRIVQDLKSFSHIDEKEYKLSDINAGLDSTINIVWNELKYKSAVKKEYGDIPMTKCKQGQLNQVFMNLLVNAAQAIEKQGKILVRTMHEGGYIFVSVSDNGCGIPREILNRVFEPFFTTKEVGKGTGLGLSIAYDIVKKHNGEILIESEVGKGTTFTIKIPVIDK